MPEPVNIIIPAFNQLEYCRQCVASILRNTRRAYRLILVDNGSTDGVGAFFDAVPGAHVVHSPENLGFAGGVNLGLRRVEAGHALLLNSDTIVPAGWLERLETALLQDDAIGLAGPRSNEVSGSQRIEGLDFASLDAISAYADGLYAEHGPAVRDVARLVGFCLLIRDAALEHVGLFDEGYGIGNYEDDDYCLRCLRAGFRLCVAEGCFVFHYGSRTFLGMGVTGADWRALIDANAARFAGKWQAKPEERSDAVQESRRLNHAGREAFARREPTEAVRLFTQGIETCPQFEPNYNDLGAVLWEMGAPAEAFDQFVRALRINPAYAEARDNLRAAAQALGRLEEAAALLDPSGKDAQDGF